MGSAHAKVIKIVLSKLLLAMLFILSISTHPTFAGEFVVICHKEIPDSAFTKQEIRNIFLGDKTTWNNDKRIVLAVLKSGESHEQFVKEIIGKTDLAFKRHWKRLQMTGKGIFPKFLNSEKDLINYVANTEGAIGYASQSANMDKVKQLRFSKL